MVLETVVTYLEMRAPPAGPDRQALPSGHEIRRALRPPVGFYRYLYDAIGGDWYWVERKALSDAELATILDDPMVEMHVLWCHGVPAGLAELDWRQPSEVQLTYFGLTPAFVGQGLGGQLLGWAIDHVWRQPVRRFWLHTCDLDHPSALSVYQKYGFRPYQQQVERVTVPLGTGNGRPI